MEPRLFNSKQAAKYLCISEKSLWNLTNAGEICAVRMRRLVRYEPADLDEFIQRSKTKISKNNLT